ncbi:MAG: hypothetical protein ACYC1C_14120 [Chloroflexota bacterium]
MSHFAVAKDMGITDEEIEETIQLAASAGAASIVAMATRARRIAETESRLWRRPEGRI